MRRWAAALVTLLGVFLLAGCFRVDTQLKVNPNDTVDGSVIVAVNQSMMAMSGATVDDFAPDNLFAFPTSATPYDDGTLVGKTFTFRGVPLRDFSGLGLTITHPGHEFEVSGTATLGQDTSGLTGGTVKVAVTFPEPVTYATGTVSADGRTVTWTGDGTTPLSVEARGGDAWWKSWISVVVFGIVMVAAFAGVAAYLLLRHTHPKAPRGYLAPPAQWRAPQGPPPPPLAPPASGPPPPPPGGPGAGA